MKKTVNFLLHINITLTSKSNKLFSIYSNFLDNNQKEATHFTTNNLPYYMYTISL